MIAASPVQEAFSHDFDEATTHLLRRKTAQIARKFRLGEHDAADVEQKLALKLWKALGRYDPRVGPLKVYAKVVVQRCASSLVRDFASRRRPRSLSRVVSDGDDRPTEWAQLVVDRQATRERIELKLDVEGLLDDLPDEDRESFELVKHESVAQAAKDMGIPRSTLVDRLRRYRQRFEDGNLDEYLPSVRQLDRRPGIR